MVNPNTMDELVWLRKQLDGDGDDLIREMVREFAQRLMAADVDAVVGAGWGEINPDRVNHRNGYRARDWDTRAGTIDLAIPKLRRGSYFPDWLLDPRRRAEKALVAAVAECYVRGVSTLRVDGLVKTLGIESLSKSQVSRMAVELDAMVAEFRNRPLENGPYTYVWMDALTQKVREGGRIINIATVIAVGVNADGHREVLGVDVITTEDGAGWLAFLRGPRRPGPLRRGVGDLRRPSRPRRRDRLDAGRCGLATVPDPLHAEPVDPRPKSAQSMVATLVRTIFAQPDAESVWAQHGRVVVQLDEQFPDAATHLDDAAPDVLAFTAFPKEHWKQIWSNNPQERLNKEVRRRTDVVGIFPNRDAIVRLVGAVLAEQHDEWAVARRYMSVELLTRARMRIIDGDLEEVTQHALTEVS